MCWCVTILREEDRIRTLARCLYCNIKKNMSSVVLPQTAYFCHQLRLNRWVLLCSDFGIRAHMGWWNDGSVVCVWQSIQYVSVCVRDLKGMSWWRQKKKRQGRRDGAGCTRRKLGLMLLHAAAPKHPHSSCWSVCLLFVYRFSVLRPHEERGTCIVSTVLVLTYSFEWIYVAIFKCGVDHASGLAFLLSISEEAK